jgi:hypothetical protein
MQAVMLVETSFIKTSRDETGPWQVLQGVPVWRAWLKFTNPGTWYTRTQGTGCPASWNLFNEAISVLEERTLVV